MELVSADLEGSAESRTDEPAVVAVAPPAPGMTRVRMTLAYDGARFHGMAENAGVATVVGTIRPAIERVAGHPVTISMAGRTDRGVHAWGQVVSFDVATEAITSGRAAPDRLARSVNRQCVPAIVVRDCSITSRDFDARFSATSRTYRYTVLQRPVPDPFLAATSWWIPTELDLARLRLGCDALIGSHDFSSFCRRPKPAADAPVPSLVRRVTSADWHALDDGILRFEITASSFCHQMVRSVVGTLVEMGRGLRRPGEMAGIIAARDRAAAGGLAPPQGLCLWTVGYGPAAAATSPNP